MKKAILTIALAATAVFGLEARKLSPNAEVMLMTLKDQKAQLLKSFSDSVKTEVESVKVFLDVNDPRALNIVEAMGGRVFMTYGTSATAEIPVSALRAVSELEGIDYVDMGAPVHLCMDKTRNLSLIDMVHANTAGELPSGYTGNGVVVGLIDIGMEFDHIAFRAADGKTSRLKRVWVQSANGGRSPEKFGYGVEYSTPEEMKAAKYDTSGEYHGTHTSSIAAGGDRTSNFYGVAPDADIVFVSMGQNSVDIPNGIQYIKDYAESVGKPCVINMSLGSHLGPHDGTSSLDKFFDRAAGPGCLLVGSAGNEGEDKFHINKTISPDASLKTILTIPSGSNKSTAVDIWGRQPSAITVKVCVLNAKGKAIETHEIVSTGSKTAKYFADEGVDAYFVAAPNGHGEDENPNVYIKFYITSIADGRYIGITVEGEEGQEVNMWDLRYNEFSTGGFRGFTASDGTMSVGEIGGTGNSVITVGSYNSRFTFPVWSMPGGEYVLQGYDESYIPEGHISAFSSHGPTADGRMKPDVLAPGALVIAAANKYYFDQNQLPSTNERVIDSNGKEYYYFINIGTSMASPVVAGSMALWLEAYPDLTPQLALDAIAATAVKDQYTGSEPNNNAGHGKMDTYNGLKYVLANSGISNVSADSKSEASIKVWVEGKQLCVASAKDVEVAVYSITGATVKQFSCREGMATTDVSSLPAGVYIVRAGKAAVKIAIR